MLDCDLFEAFLHPLKNLDNHARARTLGRWVSVAPVNLVCLLTEEVYLIEACSIVYIYHVEVGI
jgi:hypothetical protein